MFRDTTKSFQANRSDHVSSLAATSELVPNKHRGKIQAALDLTILPWSVFGSLTGGAMVTYHGRMGFRINFYIGLALNIICLILTYLWYHPVSYRAI
jgi:hypothetical protein